MRKSYWKRKKNRAALVAWENSEHLRDKDSPVKQKKNLKIFDKLLTLFRVFVPFTPCVRSFVWDNKKSRRGACKKCAKRAIKANDEAYKLTSKSAQGWHHGSRQMLGGSATNDGSTAEAKHRLSCSTGSRKASIWVTCEHRFQSFARGTVRAGRRLTVTGRTAGNRSSLRRLPVAENLIRPRHKLSTDSGSLRSQRSFPSGKCSNLLVLHVTRYWTAVKKFIHRICCTTIH